jgi:hypothetical protein
MQHELYANPNPRSRCAYPFIVVLQADVAEGETRLIAPLAPRVGPFSGAVSRALPVIHHDDRQYVLTLPLISAMPRRRLRKAVGSLAPYRADITRALDFLLFGI